MSAIQKQHQKVLRTLMRSPSNKKCADCGEQCAVNVDVTHGIFVCTNCSGIHREFGDRIKSVSMASFTPDEINMLQKQTNEDFNRVWMAKWKPHEMPVPLNADDHKRRAFLTAKYQEKRWYSKRAAASSAPAQEEAPAHQGQHVQPMTAQQQAGVFNQAPPQQDLFGGLGPAQPAQPAQANPFLSPQQQQPQAWSPFEGGGAPAPAAPKQSNDLLDFGLDEPTPQQQQQKQVRNDLKSLVDLMGPAQPQQQQPMGGFGGPMGGFGGQPQQRPMQQPMGGFGQPQQQPMGGFGGPMGGFGAPQQQQPMGGFGQQQPMGGFGGQPQQQPMGGFGGPMGGFGGQPQQRPMQQPMGGFGQPQQQQPMGGFGGPMGGFGGQPQQQQPMGGFGQPQQQQPMGGFGAPMGGFGGQPQQRPMGQPGFGGQPQPQQQQRQTSAFDDLGLGF